MAYSPHLGTRKKRKRPPFLFALVLLILVFVALVIWRIGASPEIELATSVPGIGNHTDVTAKVSEPSRGVSDVRVELQQAERIWELANASHEPRPFWAFWGERETDVELQATIEGGELEGLAEGEAIVRVVADRAGTWLRRPGPEILEQTLPVRLRPPSLDLGPIRVNVRQGGSGLVAYRVGETATESGVMAGDDFFPGFKVPGGGPQDRFALFAVPYDSSDSSLLALVVRDDLGNELSSRFISRFTAKPLKTSQIRLNDAFLEKVVGEIVPRTAGLSAADNPLDSYLEINGDLRRSNRAELAELAKQTSKDFLWSEPFVQQPNSQLMDDFAARRTYLYDGNNVDTQDHLGFDLASVQRAPVISSNSGKVALARYFGIYGNAVVVDHGYGLQSLYAHLSSIDVDEGEQVQQGQTLGRSGETGLAGGDHLHFAILVGGKPVDPLEWFDRSWIETRIVEALPGAGLLPAQ